MTFIANRFTALLAIVLLVAVSCRPQQISTADVRLELNASDRLVGKTTLLLSVTDKAGSAIANPGALSIRGDMNHAGMVPVFAESDEAINGIFSLPFEWTMAGAWNVEARLTLPNGDVAVESFSFEIGSEAGERDMPEMEHSTSETSAVYMRITNRGETDHVIVSAASAAAEHINFHKTVVEDDIARMAPLEALVIPAGKSLELRPGSTHIMLTGLHEDLQPDSQLSLQLKCSTGEVYSLSIRIADMLMNEIDDAVEFGDLVFSGRWARPARAGGMSHDHMPIDANAESSASQAD